jgi:hypothetical protein
MQGVSKIIDEHYVRHNYDLWGTSAPLACLKRWLNWGSPLDETAKTKALCHSRCGAIKYIINMINQTQLWHQIFITPKFLSLSMFCRWKNYKLNWGKIVCFGRLSDQLKGSDSWTVKNHCTLFCVQINDCDDKLNDDWCNTSSSVLWYWVWTCYSLISVSKLFCFSPLINSILNISPS